MAIIPCNCQPYRRQLRMSTQRQQQIGVTLSPHHRQENTASQDQTLAQVYRTPRGLSRLGTYITLSPTNRITRVISTVLYHLHTRPPTLCKRDLLSLPTLILIIVLLYHIYIYKTSLINCIQPDDGHSSIGRNM